LLSAFLVRSPARTKTPIPHFNAYLKGFCVIWTLLIHHEIVGRRGFCRLRNLLKNALEIHLMTDPLDLRDMWFNQSQDESTSAFHSSIEIDRCDQCFKDRTSDR